MSDELVFEMPPGIGFAVFAWDQTGQVEHQIDGQLSIESGDLVDEVRLGAHNLDAGDLVIVQTVSSVDAETFQRMFDLERSVYGGLDAVMVREASMVGIDVDGGRRSIGDAVVLDPRGELRGADVAAVDGLVVADVFDGFGEITKQWAVTTDAAGSDQFSLVSDRRSYQSTGVAYEAVRQASGDVGSAVIVVANEDVVGVVVDTSDDRFVVAATAAAGEFESFETIHDVESTLSIGTDRATLQAGVVEAQRWGLQVAPSLLSADLFQTGRVAVSSPEREIANDGAADGPSAEVGVRARAALSRSLELDSFDL